VHRFIIGMLLLAQQANSRCGSPADQNTVLLTVNAGPTANAANVAYVSVTICVPGQASNCQTIDNVLVDTGSTGLRVLASALTLRLQPQTTSAGATVDECFSFQDGFMWGPVATADVKVGTKQAKAVPIQIAGAAGTPSPPDTCTSSGLASEDTLDTLGANGVLGLAVFRQDCGLGCSFAGSSNPGLYYACSTSGCLITAEALTQQVQNPVWMFPDDNNGVVIQLPTVPLPGQAAVYGMLIFGIGTQSNNALGNATVFTLDANGNFVTRILGTSATAFIDSGSNGYYFLDAATARMPICRNNADFYCPTTTLTLQATNVGSNGKTGSVTFGVANAEALPDFAVLPQLGGPFSGFVDCGLPFFYGRRVFTAIEGQSTPGGTGPYFAY
jgi:hypothetical protein